MPCSRVSSQAIVLGGRVDARRHVVEDATPLRRTEAPPLDLPAAAGGHRRLDGGIVGHRRGAHDVPRRRVGHLDGGGPGGPLAAEEERPVGHRADSRRHRSS